MLKLLLLRSGLAVNLEEGQKLPEQPVAGEFERDNGAFEALEEVRTDIVKLTLSERTYRVKLS